MLDTSVFPSKSAEILLAGPAGKLQLLATSPTIELTASLSVAVICHPHPQFGGTMDNKVVTTLHRAFHDLGMRTVRFNYRGVGKSEGQFDEGVGETDDTLAVLDWVSQTCPNAKLYLAGFSFGAYVSYRVATQSAYREKLAYLLSITMPQYSGLATLPEPQCAWCLIQGEADEIVDAEAVFQWVKQLKSPPQVIKMPETSHFFHSKLVLLRETIIKQLT